MNSEKYLLGAQPYMEMFGKLEYFQQINSVHYNIRLAPVSDRGVVLADQLFVPKQWYSYGNK